MGPSDILKKFFEEQRIKYHGKSLKDFCLSGRLRFRDQEQVIDEESKITIKTLLVPPTKTLSTRKKRS